MLLAENVGVVGGHTSCRGSMTAAHTSSGPLASLRALKSCPWPSYTHLRCGAGMNTPVPDDARARSPPGFGVTDKLIVSLPRPHGAVARRSLSSFFWG